ncbi:hypothetical protein M011DRAFT_489523 [Sporormia fimetaria CBS 119925]|uniref:VIT-domain-containing protein n=1 Tax=Sporormia fimetaria CBS 119925 TaxID=1340428 RepID=A0A6A6V195_9PLEO|nr:hypothetical protein M011DRAFT_489523 [Sporormia fimetaria CBS 119925]
MAFLYPECGLYYVVSFNGSPQRLYLPQVNLQAHATILSTTSRTVLTQTFTNPSDTKGIRETTYTFPLYDGVSVVGFVCQVGNRKIVGEVKEKEKARADFSEAAARGETAGLFEQLPDASDAFTTTIANIPPGADVVVTITYLGELKHDMEVDGTRFTIPTKIHPRYGTPSFAMGRPTDPFAPGPKPGVNAQPKGIFIAIDAEVPDGSFIQKITSPSHPIAVSMGTTSVAPRAEPSMNKASATLSLDRASLDVDFVLHIVAKDTGTPKAVLETHPTIPQQRALMATLVPKFALPAQRPEIVFVCDRSGSMHGTRIQLATQALKVFLKSLPVGVKFNICSFGTRYSFLWDKSVSYSQETLNEAMAHVENFDSSFGGTEMYRPLEETLERRYKDIPLEVMLITDGDIWDQQRLFGMLNRKIGEDKAPIRVFTLGIGTGASNALIEGVAKAGNGFSQAVAEGERFDAKVVRMLKGALSPHLSNCQLEVKWAGKPAVPDETEDDFEVVTKVTDELLVRPEEDDNNEKEEKEKNRDKAPMSLFDPSADPDKDVVMSDDLTGEARFAHLPFILPPKLLQAPQAISSLFAFNRTTVYLLLGPDTPQSPPESITLRADSELGPLALEIPVQVHEKPGETIHQLAAKKAISELEQGRGWLPEARDVVSETLLKEKYESRFSDMVEREAVRLGVKFQVGGKWCSFVAVEKKEAEKSESDDTVSEKDYEWLDDASTLSDATPGSNPYDRDASASTAAWRARQVSTPRAGQTTRKCKLSAGGGTSLFGSSSQPGCAPQSFSVSQPSGAAKLSFGALHAFRAASAAKPSFFGGHSQPSGFGAPSQPSGAASLFGVPPQPSRAASLFGAPPQPYGPALPFETQQFSVAAPSPIERGENAPQLMAQTDRLAAQSTAFASSNKKSSSSAGFLSSVSSLFGQQSGPSPQAQRQRQLQPQMQAQAQAQIPSPAPAAFNSPAAAANPPPPTGLFGSANPQAQPQMQAQISTPSPATSNFPAACSCPLPPTDLFGSASANQFDSRGLFGSASSFAPVSGFPQGYLPPVGSPFGSSGPAATHPPLPKDIFANDSRGLFGSASASAPMSAKGSAFGSSVPSAAHHYPLPPPNKSMTNEDILDIIVRLQTFEGFWEYSSALLTALTLDEKEVKKAMASLADLTEKQVKQKAFMTCLVIAFLEFKLAGKKDVWDLIAEKARNWLDGVEGVGNKGEWKSVAVRCLG